MEKQFPRTTVGGMSLSRFIIGSNWILGYSHRTNSADQFIKRFHSAQTVCNMVSTFLKYGIDTIMVPFLDQQHVLDGIKMAEDATGKKVILITTPILNMDDNQKAREESAVMIHNCKKLGADFCFPHHSSTEELINKNKKTMDRLPDYLSMIRDNDMIPGLSAHMPEVVIYADLNEYDVETYIQIFNCMGFLMQVEVEYIHRVIWNAKKPVMTIKPMAAGRVTPFVGLTFNWNAVRPQDMITVGCLTPDEAEEDIEISFAALEHRLPNQIGRNSPNKTAIMQH